MTMPRACVAGWPVKHSRSPKIHGYWLEQLGIAGEYGVAEVTPEDFEGFITDLGGAGYVGANITMPHKDAAFALSEPDERARAVGAANTLWLEGGRLKSTNTDVEGFIGGLDWRAPGWDKRLKAAVVLGAGGAARAVAHGLLERGAPEIRIVNRTLAKAEALRERFGSRVVPVAMADAAAALEGADLLANSTALGMAGQGALEIDITGLAPGAVVSDIVYVPLKTPLLAAAEARGHPTSNGLDMLLHQAVRGFELWFGRRPEVTQELYDMIAADIEG